MNDPLAAEEQRRGLRAAIADLDAMEEHSIYQRDPMRRALERILETARRHEARDRPELRIITTNWLIEVCEEGLAE